MIEMVCVFMMCYESFLLDGLIDVRVNDNYAHRAFFRWNWNIIELQYCDSSDFEHELTHFIMKKVGWSLEQSKKHDFVFEGTRQYIKEHMRC